MRQERGVSWIRLGCAALLLPALAVGSCKKAEAPPSEAPASKAPAPAEQPALAPGAPAPSAPGQAAAAPEPAPTVGSTKDLDSVKADEQREKSKRALAQEPTTLADAEQALDQALAELNLLAGTKAAKGSATPLAAGDTRCPEACKAMESLRRAAASVCRLAGDPHARCDRAKKIVKDSEARVAVCKCETPKD